VNFGVLIELHFFVQDIFFYYQYDDYFEGTWVYLLVDKIDVSTHSYNFIAIWWSVNLIKTSKCFFFFDKKNK